jgi:hypothetical protein
VAPRRPHRRRLALLTLCLASTLLAVAVAELTVRALLRGGAATGAARGGELRISQHHPLLGWVPRPGVAVRHVTPEFDVAVRTDARGARVAAGAARGAAAPGVAPMPPRMVAVGDSFVFGWGVEAEESFAALLAGAAGGELVNLGVAGYGVDQQLLMLRERGLPLRPGLVLVGLHLPDVFRNELRVQAGRGKPWFELRGGGRLGLAGVPVPDPAPRLPRRGLDRLDLVLRGRQALAHRGVGRVWPLTAAILGAMANDCAAAGARLLVVLVPTDHAVHGSRFERWTADLATGRLRSILAAERIEHVDPTARMRAAAAGPGPRLYYPRDGHLTIAGHRVVAEAAAPRARALLGR